MTLVCFVIVGLGLLELLGCGSHVSVGLIQGWNCKQHDSFKALQVFWASQKATPWFQSHPILSDPDP